MNTIIKSHAKRFILIGALFLLLSDSVKDKPEAWAITLITGSVLVAIGGSMYYWQEKRKTDYKIKQFKYSNAA